MNLPTTVAIAAADGPALAARAEKAVLARRVVQGDRGPKAGAVRQAPVSTAPDPVAPVANVVVVGQVSAARAGMIAAAHAARIVRHRSRYPR
jgi:hypothetical protein